MNWDLVFSGTTAILIGIGIKYLIDIREDVGKISGRIGKLETWKEDHSEIAKERDDKLHGRIHGLESRIKG